MTTSELEHVALGHLDALITRRVVLVFLHPEFSSMQADIFKITRVKRRSQISVEEQAN